MQKKFLVLASVLLLCFSVFLFGFASPKSVSALQDNQWEIVEIDGVEYYKKPLVDNVFISDVYVNFDGYSDQEIFETLNNVLGETNSYIIFSFYDSSVPNIQQKWQITKTVGTYIRIKIDVSYFNNNSLVTGNRFDVYYDTSDGSYGNFVNDFVSSSYSINNDINVGTSNALLPFFYYLEEVPKTPYIDSPSLIVGGIVSVFTEFIPAFANGIGLTFSNLFIDGQNLSVLGSVFMTFIGIGLCVSIFRVVYKIFRNRIKTKV